MYEQVTAEEVILAVVENMHQSLEPLLFSTWAPSLYHVYLRRHDYERLRGIFPAIADEAKVALDRELEALNKSAKGTGGLFGAFRKGQAAKRYHKPGDEYAEDWDVSGSIEDLRLLFEVGARVANSKSWPAWRQGNEFLPAREAIAKSREPEPKDE